MNSAVIVGRAGQDPEVKYFESGKVKTTFSLAVNRWDPKTKSEIADWFNIDVWDKQAEFAGEYVKKGRLVAVDGRIAINKWTDATGSEKQRFNIIANNTPCPASASDLFTNLYLVSISSFILILCCSGVSLGFIIVSIFLVY